MYIAKRVTQIRTESSVEALLPNEEHMPTPKLSREVNLESETGNVAVDMTG